MKNNLGGDRGAEPSIQDSEFDAAKEYYGRKDRSWEDMARKEHELLVDCRGQLQECMNRNENLAYRWQAVVTLLAWSALLLAIVGILLYFRGG